MDLIQFIRVLLKRKNILIVVPLMTVIITYFLTRNLPDVYSSEGQIATGLTDESKIQINKEEDKESEIKQRFSNIIELMKSKIIIDMLSYNLVIHDLTEPFPFRKPGKLVLETTPEGKEKAVRTFRLKLDSAQYLQYNNPHEKGMIALIKSMGYDEEALSPKLKVARLENSDYISVKFESENAELSAYVVNTLCAIFIDYYRKINKGKSIQALSFFARLVDEKKRELDEYIDILKNYKIKNRVINLYEQTKSIDGQIAAMEMRREDINKNVAGFTAALKEINGKLTDNEKKFLEFDISPYSNEIISLKDKLKELSDRTVLDDSQVLRDSISRTRSRLDKEVKRFSDEYTVNPNAPKQDLVLKRINYEVDLEVAIYNVKSIDKEIQRLKTKFDIYTPLDGTIKAMEMDVDVAAKVYLSLLSRLNEEKLKNNIEAVLQQTQYGEPGAPQPSKKMILIILSALISFVLCVVILFILEYIDLTIKTPKKFLLLTGLGMLGYLNLLKSKKLDLKHIFSTEDLSYEFDTFKQLLRSLRYELLDVLQDNKILLFTSTSEGDGKTLTIISLSYSFAIAGKKVLILDANFMNNSLTDNFGAKPMLEEFLSGKASKEDSVSSTSIEGISIIGCRGGIYSPIEITDYTSMKAKFHDLAADYDLIFIEGPALNKYSGSKELFSVTEKVAGVFSANKVLEESDKNGIRILKDLDDKFIGAILNNVDLENLEQVYGEMDKKRSGVRKFVKRLVKRKLFADKDIKNIIVK
ncbi:MAG: Wzz/FepE/Etk N-terminal domain-containing protein [Ignavibacteriae bacterium]|nr:Wzz/FepE/Etk N-terminal domain-containing protein [Ignavibacteriota bacterium]